jgi:hypothetical protein
VILYRKYTGVHENDFTAGGLGETVPIAIAWPAGPHGESVVEWLELALPASGVLEVQLPQKLDDGEP